MKFVSTLMVVGFLLVMAPGASAADAPSNVEIAPAAQAQDADLFADEALATPTVDCEAEAAVAAVVGSQEGTPAGGQTCGACSSPNCNGATRGQLCNYGGGWGNCNIYSGGYMCSTGGWECQCGTGPLP